MRTFTHDLPFEVLGQHRCGNGRQKLIVQFSDGTTECLWPDEVASIRINQKLRRQDLARRKPTERGLQSARSKSKIKS